MHWNLRGACSQFPRNPRTSWGPLSGSHRNRSARQDLRPLGTLLGRAAEKTDAGAIPTIALPVHLDPEFNLTGVFQSKPGSSAGLDETSTNHRVGCSPAEQAGPWNPENPKAAVWFSLAEAAGVKEQSSKQVTVHICHPGTLGG